MAKIQLERIAERFPGFGIVLTPSICQKMHHLLTAWELRGTHPLCLNSQLIGIHPIVFTDTDRSALFHLVGLEESTVARVIKDIADSAKLDEITIDLRHKVASDPFNLLSVWLIHLGLGIKDEKMQHQFRLDVAKYLHYKYFTSLVNWYLVHGADESVMLAAVTSLNRRFDLIVQGSWRLMFAERCETLVSKDPSTNIHADTFVSMKPDQSVSYILSDTQTRVRDKIKGICEIYYNFHKDGVKITSTSAVSTNSEGEKMLRDRSTTLDSAITTVTTELMSVSSFIKNGLIQDLSKQFNDVSPALLRFALETMAQIAVAQARNRTIDDVKTLPGGMFQYVGMRALVREIIQTSIEYCARNNIPMTSKAKIYFAIRNRFSSSQMKDERILSVKNSVEDFVDDLGKTSRAATKASLRLAIIMYVITRCLMEI